MCIIHIGEGQFDGEIKCFLNNLEQWEKVQDCAVVREESFSSSKYDAVLKRLPQVFEQHHGYDGACYSKFTSVQKSKIRSSTANFTTPSARPGRGTKNPCSTPVSEVKCIFCNLVHKKHNTKW